MRITKDTLLTLANEAVEERAKSNKQLIAAYLHGSLLGEDSLLGDSTDIDLTFVYRKGFTPEIEREFIRISPDVHLDVLHHDEGLYKPPRTLRGQPWLGYAVYDFKIIHDPKHFLNFVQAGVRNSFFEPEIIFERVGFFYASAREIWSRDGSLTHSGLLQTVKQYFLALENAANAVISLNGPPLPMRRLLAALPQRMAEISDEGLFAGFLGLAGLTNMNEIDFDTALLNWHEVFPVAAQVNEEMPIFRLAYYRNAIQHWLDSGNPAVAAWILLHTWINAVLSLSGDERNNFSAPLEQFLASLGFTAETIKERWAGLDLYLDKVEEVFEAWKIQKGI